MPGMNKVRILLFVLYTQSHVGLRCRGKFSHGATLTVFADDASTAKIKTAESFDSPVGTVHAMHGFVAKNKICESIFLSIWWHFRKSSPPPTKISYDTVFGLGAGAGDITQDRLL